MKRHPHSVQAFPAEVVGSVRRQIERESGIEKTELLGNLAFVLTESRVTIGLGPAAQTVAELWLIKP
jgi:hypothetical protein